MRRAILLTCVFIFLSFSSISQSPELPAEGPAYYFNSFQHYTEADNVDSSLYFIRLLAAGSSGQTLLEDLLHNSFAQAFIRRKGKATTADARRHKTATTILAALLLDTNIRLAETVKPVGFWVKIQQNENNVAALRKLTTGFIKTELAKADIYSSRTARYALLIHQILIQKKELKTLAAQLFNATAKKLKGSQVSANVGVATRDTLAKRAWCRYLYAYVNYIKAKESASRQAKAGYLKKAFDYSPDETDRNYRWAYGYDAYFLFDEEKAGFQEDYFNFLLKGAKDRNAALSIILSMALTNRDYKDQLKNFYKANFPGGRNFDSFWVAGMNKNLKTAPAISLKGLDGKDFSLSGNKGKWVLIDFWGTWCGPCRKEHPELEKFCRDVVSKDTGRLALLTIACNDDEHLVTSYIAQYKYSFPVVMSDGKVEKAYGVSGYPYKVLVTPQGRYVVIPFGTDWVNFIKGYADL